MFVTDLAAVAKCVGDQTIVWSGTTLERWPRLSGSNPCWSPQ